MLLIDEEDNSLFLLDQYHMKKISVLLVVVSMLFVYWCGNSSQSEETTEEKAISTSSKHGDVSKQECIQWCEMMRKSNEGNKERSATDMDKDCNNLCEASQGMQNGDINSCEKSEGVLKDICYTDIAKTNKDSSLCEKITDQTMMGSCYTFIAEETKDPSLCAKVTWTIREDICMQNIQK